MVPGASGAERIHRGKPLEIVIVLLVAALVHWLTREPWQPAQVKRVTGIVSGYGPASAGKLRCFRLTLAAVEPSFRLCSIGFRLFDRAAFERDVQVGEPVELIVVRELWDDPATRAGSHSVQGVRTPDGREYLGFDRVQASLARERAVGRLLMLGVLTFGVLRSLLSLKDRYTAPSLAREQES